MTIFYHSLIDVENYPIVSPLSLIISFNNPIKDHPHTGGKDEKRHSLKTISGQMLDAGRQIWKIRVSKDIELIPQKSRSEQEQNKDNEKEPREMEN